MLQPSRRAQARPLSFARVGAAPASEPGGPHDPTSRRDTSTRQRGSGRRHAELRAAGQSHRAGSIRRLQRPGGAARHPDEPRRASLVRHAQRLGRRERPDDRAAHARRRLRARSLQGQHRALHPRRRVLPLRLRRHADVARGAAARQRVAGALLRPVPRRRSAARAAQQDGLPRPRVVLRRDRADRAPADEPRAQEDRRVPSGRCLRQGRARRRELAAALQKTTA